MTANVEFDVEDNILNEVFYNTRLNSYERTTEKEFERELSNTKCPKLKEVPLKRSREGKSASFRRFADTFIKI